MSILVIGQHLHSLGLLERHSQPLYLQIEQERRREGPPVVSNQGTGPLVCPNSTSQMTGYLPHDSLRPCRMTCLCRLIAPKHI